MGFCLEFNSIALLKIRAILSQRRRGVWEGTGIKYQGFSFSLQMFIVHESSCRSSPFFLRVGAIPLCPTVSHHQGHRERTRGKKAMYIRTEISTLLLDIVLGVEETLKSQ